MALATGTLWEIRASATTGNVNGAGFNTANANFPTDATATSATGNAPVISSATYTFVAGDVGSWVYIKAGTNWTPGFYQISSVAGGAATVNATIGAAVQLNSTTNMYGANTVAGVATTASPSGGTFGVDYSQQDAANSTVTNLASAGAVTTVTSVTAPWTAVSVGNIIHITTTGTGAHFVVGWYEIVTFTLTSAVVLDRVPDDGTAGVAGTAQTGGAGRFNGLEDAFYEMVPTGSMIYIKNGTYVFSAGISIASTNGTVASPILSMGYNALRGDTCNGANRPVLTLGSGQLSLGSSNELYNVIVTGTGTGLVAFGNNGLSVNCKPINTSATAARPALSLNNTNVSAIGCEIISQNGLAISSTATSSVAFGCYIHDSVTGATTTTTGAKIVNCIFEACSTDAIISTATSTGNFLIGNTIYGREAKIGTGININTASSACHRIWNNILYGLTTGVGVLTTAAGTNTGGFNDYFNNTTDVSNFNKSSSALALDPTFAGAAQVTGSTATTSGSVLTQSGGDFSTVTDNVDYLRVISGTGVTVGGYLITSHTATTLTVNNALGTSSGGDVIYFVTTGHNFAIGNTTLKTGGYPSFGTVMNVETTSYPAVGAVAPLGASVVTTGGTYAG